jgi:hypothetical protein
MALGLGEEAQVADSVWTDLTARGILSEARDVFCRPFAEFVRQELER